ncbi:DUF1295 domain-containing protein [Govanella unica]|uniref:DUF1295 domain-containing protein n=1 Tax=Govanella unica TaxID=2975056 RepID=A0A9X3TY12_9PROT|nr:DUF1295 domain-containing protein [Govania unica]MDA5193843.1 DUF1295 domain-containing protein [Govania unica]
MTETLEILVLNFAIIVGCMVLLWLISIPLKDVSFIDSFWALGCVLLAVSTYFLSSGTPDRKLLILALTAAWGLRLGGYIFWRWQHEGADGRYVALLKKAQGNVNLFSLRKVFLLQAPLLWITSLPAQMGQIPAEPVSLGVLAAIGTALALVGIFFETVGDWQLARFKNDPDNHGKVMDRGLWRYTRHPNYFGDACVWWGIFLVAAETKFGFLSIFGPLFLTFTLVKWSGAALLERRMKRSRPGYEDYVRRTSGFLPWPPKKA